MAARGRPRKVAAAPGGGSEVSVVVRALDILDAVALGSGPLSMTDIVHRTGLHKATVFRLLTTLVAEDLLRQTSSGEYELGYFAAGRATAFLRSSDLWCRMQPAMIALQAALRETVVLSLRDEDHMIDIDMATAPTPVMQMPPIGQRQPLHQSPAGQAVLLAETVDWRQNYCHRHGLDAQRYQAGSASARHAADLLAAPVVDAGGTPVGALWLSIPPGRSIDRRAYAAALLGATS